MINYFVQIRGQHTQCHSERTAATVSVLWSQLKCFQEPHAGDFYVVCNGRRVSSSEHLQDGAVYHVVPRLVGGKGGFGSMLRAIGAQIEKTTSREACRDLSGRRMRDVNNEKKLREWVSEQAKREKERERLKQERKERRRAVPKHNFDDPQYTQQKMQVAEELEDALQEGLQRAAQAGPSGVPSTSSRKRKAAPSASAGGKKAKGWLGLDVDNISDLDSDTDEEESRANPEWSHDSAQESGHGSASPSTQSDSESPSDSGVESVQEKKKSESIETMDLDPTSEDDPADKAGVEEEVQKCATDACMHTDSDSDKTEEHCEPKTDALQKKPQHGLLRALASLPSTSDETQVPTQPTETKDLTEIDLNQYHSAAELEALGGDALKMILTSMGLKCGGTPTERAERLFSVRGLSKEEIDPKLFAKPSKGKRK